MHELLNRLSFLAPFFYALLGATILAIFATAYLRRKRCRSAALGASESLDDKKTRRSFFSNARNFSFVRAFCWIIGIGIALMIGAALVLYLHTPTDPCSVCHPDEKTIGIDYPLDDGSGIVWNWRGPCVGAETCGKCNVKPKSCMTDNDTVFALKCACSAQ
jgi:hypothetical protein